MHMEQEELADCGIFRFRWKYHWDYLAKKEEEEINQVI